MAEKMWEVDPYYVNGIPLTITTPNDPAYFLKDDPNIFSTKKDGVLDKDDCYICLDPEFAQMGLPLCYPCEACKANPDVSHFGHVPADDTVCTECGTDAQELYYAAMAAQCATEGHVWKDHPPLRANSLKRVNGRLLIEAGEMQPGWTSCDRCGEERS